MYYALPQSIINKIKKELLSNPYVLASAPSFGNNGRMYFYKDNELRTRLMNENRKKSLEDTEMIVIDLNEASNISGIYGAHLPCEKASL